MMFGTIFRNQANVQAQVLAAQNHLDQARLERMEQHFEAALNLYNNARVAFENANQATPILSQLNRAFSRARTPEEEALRRHIADVYYERAEVLETLGGRFDEAQESRRDALAWDSNEIESASILHAVPLPVLGALLVGVGALAAPWIWAWWTRSTASTSMLLQPQSLAPMPLPPQSLAPIPVQQLPVVPAQAKSEMVDYLFEKALSTLRSLEVPNKPSLFLIYAHDNPAYGQAEADTSKYLINKLSQIQANLHSDQTPMGKPYLSSPEDLKKDGKLEDILTSQLCLLPDPLQDDAEPVDKVVVCCSEVLGKYLGWSHYEKFYQQIQEAYLKDREAYRKNGAHAGTPAIRQVVRQFSQEETYKAEFHHVLTEIAFLQIRAEQLKDQHGIIPVSLTPNSYELCLADFIPTTTVRMEDILRFDEQAKAGREVHPNQSRHWVLFKLIERLLVGNDEATTFLNELWKGYSECIDWLKNAPSMPNALEFMKFVDGIFGKTEAELHRKLVSTVQQAHKLLPPTPSLIDLRKALYQHYQLSNLSIQRVSGKQASLDDCYINLAIVESRAQREKEQEALKKQAAAFERLPSSERLEATNPNRLIAVEKLFEPQKLLDGSVGVPKRVLVYGRAGIGKTTLCKKLVYDYQHHAPWKDRFESVLWVPLRQLKTLEYYSLEKLLSKHYFASQENPKALAQAFHQYREKTLFILDGLDEVVGELDEKPALSRFLKELLNQAHVVITSRPAGVDLKLLDKLDLELETVGFSPDDVQAYIANEKYVPKSDQAAIQQFIQRTPLIQGLVNIPIQLDALCYSWDILQSQIRVGGVVTVTALYQAMVEKLWHKDGARLEKTERGKRLRPGLIQELSLDELEEQLVPEENEYLCYLAFQGLQDNRNEFDDAYLKKVTQALNQQHRKDCKDLLPLALSDDLKQISFLHTIKANLDESKHIWYFLHLTFQEFFAAKFLVRHLQAYSEAEGISGLMLSQEQLQAFITEHKYNPRYEIVWWMVAGLLRDAALEHFFTSLEEVPRDLIGGRHQQVMMGCLNEARAQLKKTAVDRLETELMQWLRFEMKQSEYGLSELGRQIAFPEYLLLSGLEQTTNEKEGIIETLGARLTLSEVAILALIDALQDDNRPTRDAAAIALITQKTLPEVAISALNNALHDDSEQIRSTAAWIIGAQKTQPEAAISTLIRALRDEDKGVRTEAAQALSEQNMLPEVAISALINTIQDEKNQAVKAVAVYALGEQKTLPEAAISALINAIQDENQAVKAVAAKALGEQKMLPEAAISALINTLQVENHKVRSAVAWALGKQEMLPEATISALTHALQDEDPDVRSAVAWALREQKTLSKTIISALTNAIQDKDLDVKAEAALALGKQKTLPEAVISALTHALQDENPQVRFEAAQALGKQKTLPEAAISALTHALQDEDPQVRSAVAWALGKQETVPETAISASTHTLQDEDPDVRFEAALALGEQKTLPEAAISALTNMLQDEDPQVRSAVAQTLGKQKMLPEAAISALINAIQDEDKTVKAVAAQALGKQKTLPEAAISALTHTLQDEDPQVRSAVAWALDKQETLPEAAISALTNALQDENQAVKDMAARALRWQKTLPEAAISTLTHALQDEDPQVRFKAALALGEHKTLPEAAISTLTHALQDEDPQVRSAVAQTLGKQETLPKAAISTLANALQDENKKVKSVVALALREQETLPEFAISALTHALQDKNHEVRFMVAQALGKQETLPEAAISALSNAIQDEDKTVKAVAALALGKQKTLPEAAISALTHALQDEDPQVRSAVAWALGRQETLPEAAISALTNTIWDENQLVKDVVALALRWQKTLPEAAISTLINALQDRNQAIKAVAVLALGERKTLPEAAISALTNALQDGNRPVKAVAAQALGEQKTLPEAAISALTNALQDEESDVRLEAANALGEQKTLSADAISALIAAIQDENKKVSSAAARALGWNLGQLYTSLPRLELKQIQTLYTRVLFPRSCKYIAPLYIQDNQLHFYTAKGPGQPIELTSEQIETLIKALREVRSEAGIPLLPEDNNLPTETQQRAEAARHQQSPCTVM